MTLMPEAPPKRLLWIDDEADNYPRLFYHLQRIMQFCGELVLARTIGQAEGMLAAPLPFDVILLDIMLPENPQDLQGMFIDLDGGCALLERMNASSFPAAPPATGVIVYTARGDGLALERIQRALDLRTRSRLLRKPMQPAGVAAVVAEYLGVRYDARAS